eukprot:IDg5560t1
MKRRKHSLAAHLTIGVFAVSGTAPGQRVADEALNMVIRAREFGARAGLLLARALQQRYASAKRAARNDCAFLPVRRIFMPVEPCERFGISPVTAALLGISDESAVVVFGGAPATVGVLGAMSGTAAVGGAPTGVVVLVVAEVPTLLVWWMNCCSKNQHSSTATTRQATWITQLLMRRPKRRERRCGGASSVIGMYSSAVIFASLLFLPTSSPKSSENDAYATGDGG